MSRDHDAKTTATLRSAVVVLRHQRGECVGELVGERTLLLARPESHLAFERQRRKLPPHRPRAFPQFADIPDRAARRGDEIGTRESVADRTGFHPHNAKRARPHDVERGRRLQQLLDVVAAPTLAHRPQELRPLELADVVADPLPRQPQRSCNPCRRLRLPQMGQDLEPHRIHQCGGLISGLYDSVVSGHCNAYPSSWRKCNRAADIIVPTILFVKKIICQNHQTRTLRGARFAFLPAVTILFPQLLAYSDIMLLAVRCMVAAVFLTSGWAKVSHPVAKGKQNGLTPGMTRFLGCAEVAGALGVLTGVLGQLAAIGLILIMLGAIKKKIVDWHIGFWGKDGQGWHYELIFVIMNLVIVTTGGGRYVIPTLF